MASAHPVSALYSPPSTPGLGRSAASGVSFTTSDSVDLVEPLYTEINIPLPPIPARFAHPDPASLSTTSTQELPRSRAHTLHSMLPFHRRRSSSSSPENPKLELEKPKTSQDGGSNMVNLMKRGRKRGQTVDAAIVPAVLMLKAELFTPSEERDMDLKERRYETIG